jgi:hypothetical protein
LLAFVIDQQFVAGLKAQFVAQVLRKDHPAGFVERNFALHNAIYHGFSHLQMAP